MSLSLGEIVTLLAAFLAFAGGLVKVVLVQVNKTLDVKFDSLEESRKESGEHWDTQFAALKHQQTQHQQQLHSLMVAMPLEYVRREDWIRFSGTIDAKMDRLYEKLDQIHARMNNDS